MALGVERISGNKRQNPIFKQNKSDKTKKIKKVKTITKIASSTGSILGLCYALKIVANGHGEKLPVSLKNLKPTLGYLKKAEFDAKDVVVLATGSILGGFSGGVLTDSKNTKNKIKEAIVQLVGNYIFPSIFVGGGMKLLKHFKNNSKLLRKTPAITFGLGFANFIAGVFVGNKVSRKINSHIFDEKDYRKLNKKDWLVQADNVCLVTSMATSGTNLAQNVSKIIPISHIIPGYCVGTKTN